MGHGASDVVNNGKTSSNQHRDSECSSECVGPNPNISKALLDGRHGPIEVVSVVHCRPVSRLVEIAGKSHYCYLMRPRR